MNWQDQLAKIPVVGSTAVHLFTGNGSKKNGKLYLPAHAQSLQDEVRFVTPEELFGFTEASAEDRAVIPGSEDFILLKTNGGKVMTTGVEWRASPEVDSSILYTDQLAVLFPSIEFDYPELWEHQKRVSFGDVYPVFQQATNSYAQWAPGRKRGRYAILTAPADRMISPKGDMTALLGNKPVRRSQYAYLVRTALLGQPWNAAINYPRSSSNNPLQVAVPGDVEHTDLWTEVGGEYAFAYYFFQVPLVDLERLLDTDLALLFLYHKEFHPNREPQGKKHVKDFMVTVLGRKLALLSQAQQVFDDTAQETRFIRGRTRIRGKAEVEAAFKAMTPGSEFPDLAQLVRWGQYPLNSEKADPHDNWRIFMNQTVRRNQWLNIIGPVRRELLDAVHPLFYARVAGGKDKVGRLVTLSWHDINMLAAQESKAGKTFWILWQMLQWFGKNLDIYHFSGATDEADMWLIPYLGGTLKTMPYEDIFVNTDDPVLQRKREAEARRMAEADHQIELKEILEAGALIGYPRVLRPAFENNPYNHYATTLLTLRRRSWKDLSAYNRLPEQLPNLFAGQYMGSFLDNASYNRVLIPPPDDTVFYPWREIVDSINQGLNGRFATWVALHNEHDCPPGFKNLFKVLLTISSSSGRYMAKLSHPIDGLIRPEFDIDMTNTALENWLARRQG